MEKSHFTCRFITEKKGVNKIDSFRQFYPAKSSRFFESRVRRNWLNLQSEKIAGQDCGAALLFHHLKGKYHKITIFTAWLILCIRRPWERMQIDTLNDFIRMEGWHCPLGNKLFHEKAGIDDIFNKTLEGNPRDPRDLRALRRLMSKKHFRSKALLLPLSTNEKFTAFFRVLESYVKGAKDPLRVLEFLRSEGYVQKSKLVRKFGFSKRQCDRTLKRLVEERLCKVEKFACRTVWITYLGPKNL